MSAPSLMPPGDTILPWAEKAASARRKQWVHLSIRPAAPETEPNSYSCYLCMIRSVMATTELGTKVENYINGEIGRLGINAVASVVEGPDDLDFSVRIQGQKTKRDFVLKDAYAVGLNEPNKQIIASILDTLTEAH